MGQRRHMKVKVVQKIRGHLHLVGQVGILLNQGAQLVLESFNLRKGVLEITLGAVGRSANQESDVQLRHRRNEV